MPHPNAPFQYAALKHLLPYIDPNQRALLSHRCPSLRTLDRLTPRKIESLCVWPAQITINNITYRMGVVWQYRKGAVIPDIIMQINKHGGVPWDVDVFGCRISPVDKTPGYFSFSDDRQLTEEEIRNDCQRRILELKPKLDRLKKKKKSIEDTAQIWKKDVEKKRLRREVVLRLVNEDIAKVEAAILPYQLRLDNNEKDLPFTLFLQLTILTNGRYRENVLATERMKYTRSIGQATKHLFGQLLRNSKCYVSSLRIAPFAYRERESIWLPAEMKLKARHLIIHRYYEEVMRSVGGFFRRINDGPFQFIGHESNGALIIKEVDPSIQIHTIRHKRIHFDFCLDYTNWHPLIDYWVIHGAPIGTWYTAYTTPWQASDWYNNMKGREGHTVVKKITRWCRSCLREYVILPLPNNTQLEFHTCPVVNHFFPLMLNFEITRSQSEPEYLSFEDAEPFFAKPKPFIV